MTPEDVLTLIQNFIGNRDWEGPDGELLSHYLDLYVDSCRKQAETPGDPQWYRDSSGEYWVSEPGGFVSPVVTNLDGSFPEIPVTDASRSLTPCDNPVKGLI